jgi:hypothetical protein
MKAILEFKLPEDASDHLLATHASDFYLSLFDMDQYLRNILKYGHEFKSADEALEKVREELHEIMTERNVSTEMVP